jgi:hypothetical protein
VFEKTVFENVVGSIWARFMKLSLPLKLTVFGLTFLSLFLFALAVQVTNKKDAAKKELALVQTKEIPANVAPTVLPAPPKFIDLQIKADRLLSLEQEGYESVKLEEFDNVMKPLREIPKDSKDYKKAQDLNKKLMEKAAIIGAERIVMGEKPRQSEWDGDVSPVKEYLRSNLNDYDSSEFVEWSSVTKVYIGKEPYWGVRLKLRAKNAFGGLILRDTYYFIRNNQVVMSKGLGAD